MSWWEATLPGSSGLGLASRAMHVWPENSLAMTGSFARPVICSRRSCSGAGPAPNSLALSGQPKLQERRQEPHRRGAAAHTAAVSPPGGSAGSRHGRLPVPASSPAGCCPRGLHPASRQMQMEEAPGVTGTCLGGGALSWTSSQPPARGAHIGEGRGEVTAPERGTERAPPLPLGLRAKEKPGTANASWHHGKWPVRNLTGRKAMSETASGSQDRPEGLRQAQVGSKALLSSPRQSAPPGGRHSPFKAPWAAGSFGFQSSPRLVHC